MRHGLADSEVLLVLAAGDRVCGLPVTAVQEVFRPLPVQAMSEPVPGVLGLVRVRGEALPLVELNAFVGVERSRPARFVSLRVQDRGVVLAVDQVSGLRRLPADALQALPPLLEDAAPAVAAVARLDPGLLLLLRTGRLLPAEAA